MMFRSKKFIQGLAVAVCVGPVVFAPPIAAHSDPPPIPPIPPSQIGVEVMPLRWSWLHWWEANRSRYLVPAQQAGVDQDAEGLSRQAMRQRAGEALQQTINDKDPGVRAASAVALGRLGAQEALPGLIALMESEPRDEVRHRVIFAAGLLGQPDSEAFLLGHVYRSDYLKTAGLLGMGWLEQATPELTGRLDGLMGDDALTVNAVSESMLGLPEGWSLKRKKQLLEKSQSPWVVGRVLGSLTEDGDAQTDALLLDIARNGKMFKQLASWRFIEQTYEDKRRYEGAVEAGGDPGEYQRNLDAWWVAHDAFVRMAPEPQRPEGMFGLPPALDLGEARSAKRFVNGLEHIYQARLRAAAVIALGEGDIKDAGHALRVALADGDDFQAVPRAYAAVALGQVGDPKALSNLISLVNGKPRRGDRSAGHTKRDDPVRGFAALGLGHYARSHQAAQGVVDRPRYESAVECLVETLADPKQPVEMRTACAMALGIAGRSENLRPMILLSRTLNPSDDAILLGHLLLAQAMLGDRNVVPAAEALLAARPNRDEMSDLLGRRGAVLAMGLTGRDEAIPPLVEAWNESFYVNREVIYALSLSGASGVGEVLIERLEESDNPYERAYMAQSLGELLSEQRPSRLAERLLVGRDFTMKDGLLEDSRMLVNRFLYEYFIPSFEEPWY